MSFSFENSPPPQEAQPSLWTLQAGSPPAREAPVAAGAAPAWLGWLDWQPALEALLRERAAAVPREVSAARFQEALAEGLTHLLAKAAAGSGCRTVVLAGGCFQNALLLESLIARLRRLGLSPHWAEAVAGNDGGLALGQLEALRRGARPPA